MTIVKVIKLSAPLLTTSFSGGSSDPNSGQVSRTTRIAGIDRFV